MLEDLSREISEGDVDEGDVLECWHDLDERSVREALLHAMAVVFKPVVC